MGLVTYLGFLGLTVGLGVAVRWLDPAVLARLGRKTGLRAVHGWVLLLVAAAWMFLPLLAGATTSGGDLWLVGPALAGLGFFLGAVAVSSLDEYRLLARADRTPPAAVAVGDGPRLVATSGRPTVKAEHEAEARTPFTGQPAVHTDWLLQRRERVGGIGRTAWQNVATDVRSVPFTLGDRVAVRGGRHRVFSGVERIMRVAPDEPLPDPAAAFCRRREDLPAPDARDAPVRVIETVVPADEPVTVVGHPQQGDQPGDVVVESAPADPLLGTHADRASPDDEPEVILIQGEAAAAATLLRRRVYWLGLGGLALILGGQAIGFALSAARIAGGL